MKVADGRGVQLPLNLEMRLVSEKGPRQQSRKLDGLERLVIASRFEIYLEGL